MWAYICHASLKKVIGPEMEVDGARRWPLSSSLCHVGPELARLSHLDLKCSSFQSSLWFRYIYIPKYMVFSASILQIGIVRAVWQIPGRYTFSSGTWTLWDKTQSELLNRRL